MRFHVFSILPIAWLLMMALTFLPQQVSGAPIQWTTGVRGNDHYYELIDATSSIAWTAAKTGQKQ